MIPWRDLEQSPRENRLTDRQASKPTGFAASSPAQQPASAASAEPVLSRLSALQHPSVTWREAQDLNYLLAANSSCPEFCCRPKTFWLQLCASLKTLAPKLHHFLCCCLSGAPSQPKTISECSILITDQKETRFWHTEIPYKMELDFSTHLQQNGAQLFLPFWK